MKKRNRKSSGGNAHDRRIRERKSNRVRGINQVRGPQPRPRSSMNRRQTKVLRRQQMEEDLQFDDRPMRRIQIEFTPTSFGIDIPQLGTTPPEQFGVGIKPTPERFSVFGPDGKYAPSYEGQDDLSIDSDFSPRMAGSQMSGHHHCAVVQLVKGSFVGAGDSPTFGDVLTRLPDECDLERPAVTPARKFIEAGEMMFEVTPDFELSKPRGMGAMDPEDYIEKSFDEILHDSFEAAAERRANRKNWAQRAFDAVKRFFRSLGSHCQ